MNTKLVLIAFLFLSATLSLTADEKTSANEDETPVEQELTMEEMKAIYQNYVDSIEQTIDYQTGQIVLRNDIATLNVPTGFKYVNEKDTETILVDVWGNVPYEEDEKPLGMLVPQNFTINSDESFAIEMTFISDGYIKDDDAKEIDYNDLLGSMQEETETVNPVRKEQGYPTVELIGWASPPYYDSANKKLHWAKELKFDDAESNTLNYDIRFLGRRGFLKLTAISEMSNLNLVQTNIDPILSSINFNEGHRYSDFNPDLDKVAAYGIGGLIAGKVLMKTGLIAKLGTLLIKSWKIIALILVGIGGTIGKFFRRKEPTGV